MTLKLPLSQTGPSDQFAQEVQAHIEALTAHRMGKPGVPAPRSTDLVESVITRQPQDGPVATRGPDRFVALPYEIYDDRPVSPEVQFLRDSIGA